MDDSCADTLTQPLNIDWPQHAESTVSTIWGRIYCLAESKRTVGLSTCKPKDYYDLTCDNFSVGRALMSDLCLTDQMLPNNILKNISKTHFVLQRDLNNYCNPTYIKDYSYNGTFVNGSKIGKGKRRILDHNDVVSMPHPIVEVFKYTNELFRPKQNEYHAITEKYFVSQTIGSGMCGIVKCIYNKSTCSKYAMKIIKKNENRPGRVTNEIKILQSVNHPCIIKTEEVIQSSDSVYIIMDLMEGGDLYNRITKDTDNVLPERICKIYFRQIVLAVKYLHEKGITHRDLKPQNILLENAQAECLLKITDFGLSKFVGEDGIMTTGCGTPLYSAPEILSGKRSYNKMVDVWSLGIILYLSLSGNYPFPEEGNDAPVQLQIIKGKFTFPEANWQGISLPAKNLIKRLLTVIPSKRITLEQILLHKWMQDNEVIEVVNNLLKKSEEVDEVKEMTSTSAKDSSSAPIKSAANKSSSSSAPKRMLPESSSTSKRRK